METNEKKIVFSPTERKRPTPLMQKVSRDPEFNLPQASEEAWIEVFHKMDEVYQELVQSQVEIERKNEELEETHKFISSVLGAMTDVLIVCDQSGRIQQVNEALIKLTELDEASLIGRPLSELFVENSEKMNAKLSEHIRTHSVISDCEVKMCNNAGENVPLSVNCSPRYDSRGRPVGIVVIGRPVGELQRAYDELDKAHSSLRKAQKQLISSEKMAALGRLVAGVAHELNNPISFVYGNMHALKQYGEKITRYLAAVDKGESAELLSKLRSELHIDEIADDILPLVDGTLEGAERVSDIVQELRRFSSTQNEPLEIFNLYHVLNTAAHWVLRGAREKPDLTITCPEDLKIHSRKGYVHQIVINLVQNAIDATAKSEDPQIDISCTQDDKNMYISVIDNGIGIADLETNQIFEPFYTTKPIGQGTGLGLYVSYNMAEELGARLTGKNNPDRGASFTISFPKSMFERDDHA